MSRPFNSYLRALRVYSCDRLMTRIRRGLGLTRQSFSRGVPPPPLPNGRASETKPFVARLAALFRSPRGLCSEQLAHARSNNIRHVPLA